MPQKNSSASSKPWPVVCGLESAIPLDVSGYLATVPASSLSPIDGFYEYIRPLITLGTPALCLANDTYGRLLMLGLVGATENYFRSLLAGLVTNCPVCRMHGSACLVPLSAVAYYHRDRLSYGLLEGVSLSSRSEIRKHTKSLTGIEIKDGESVDVALQEFDKLCQLRHAAVHAGGELGARNIANVGLEVAAMGGQRSVVIDFVRFQESVAVCQNVVRAFNTHLFNMTIHRWLNQAMLSGGWSSGDRDTFGPVCRLFLSVNDLGTRASPYRVYRQLLPRIRARMENGIGVST